MQLRRQHKGIGQHVVHGRHGAAAGMAEPADLHRRRAVRQDAGTAVGAEAVQVDQDVDFVGADGLRGLQIAHHRQADGGPSARDAGAQAAAVFLVPAEAVDLKLLALVQAVQLGREAGGGVAAEIRAQIADAQLAVQIALLVGQRRRRGAARLTGWRWAAASCSAGSSLMHRAEAAEALLPGRPRPARQRRAHRPGALLLAQADPLGAISGCLGSSSRLRAQASSASG
jgi:hypothetical protein